MSALLARARRLLPRRIGGQMALLIVLSTALLHLAITATFFLGRIEQPRHGAPPGAIAAFVRLLDGTSGSDRARIMAEFEKAFPNAEFGPASTTAHGPSFEDGRSILARELGSGYAVNWVDRGVDAERRPEQADIAITLHDGGQVVARFVPDRLPLAVGPVIGTLVFLAISITLLGIWAARQLTTPLNAFAEAAESFSLEAEPAPLPEHGPEEIRIAARAFNTMRARLRRLIDDRTQMLASIGHDLRTPITRLRLRAEFVEGEVRTPMLRDLDQMTTMVESALAYLRGSRADGGAMIAVDLAVLVETVRDEFADLGRDVVYDGPGHALVPARPDEIHRALTNLVDNAVKYGQRARIRLVEEGDNVRIEIEDDGPGIADPLREAMMAPFVRGDDTRNQNGDNGLGLGLAIARSVVKAHGGELVLSNPPGGGLLATIRLRKAAAPATVD